MDPHGVDPQQQDDDHDITPFHRISPARVATGLSNGIRRTITFITEPLSPARSEWDLESAPSTPGLEKFRRWSTIRKSTDASALSLTRPVTPPEQPRTFMTLPAEIQIVVLQHLDFGDIERLRRTCRYWYNFATPRLVRSIWGPDTFRSVLIRHCRVCLTYCPRDVTRLLSTPLDAGYPLSSRCVRCTIQSRDGTVRIGRKTTLGNFTDYWTCRWCGWPITSDQCSSHPQFHKACYDRYAFVLLAFFLLGWVQFFLGVAGSGLCWHYFRGDRLVLAPTITGFLLMWFCIILIMFRGNKVRTYNIALFLEVAVVGLWIAPVYSISKEFGQDQSPAKPSTIATLVLIGINMLFRLLNIVGNIVLITEYDRTRHYVPRIPIWRRFMNPILTALIFWTYPQHAERKFPPDYR